MKPCTVPRIQPVGDDIARLTDTFESGHRGQSRTRRAGRDDRSVGGLLFADGVEATPSSWAGNRLPCTSTLVREPQTVPRAHQRSAFDRGSGQVRPQMRTRARRHP